MLVAIEARVAGGDHMVPHFSVIHLFVSPSARVAIADEMGAEVEARKNESMIEFGCQSFQRFLFDMLGLSFNIAAAELDLEFWRAAVNV